VEFKATTDAALIHPAVNDEIVFTADAFLDTVDAAATTTTAPAPKSTSTAAKNKEPAPAAPATTAKAAAKPSATSGMASITSYFGGQAAQFRKMYTRQVREVMERLGNGEIVCRDEVHYVNAATGEDMSEEQYKARLKALTARDVQQDS
jgi:hypothetical protein